MRSAGRLLVLAIATAALAVAAEEVTVPIDDADEPVELEVSLVNGSVHVAGAPVNAVIVDVLDHDGSEGGDAHRGMKRVSKALRGLNVEQHGNRVEISLSPTAQGDLELKVPIASSAVLSTINGKVEVNGLTGELELHNTNGRIVARDVSGPVSASTVNGVVVVELSASAARSEMAFSTLNGDVDVTLPESYGANLTLSSDNGSVYSDFDVVVEGGAKPRPRHGRGQKMTGTINGGGPELLLRSFNGDIVLREKKR